MKRNLHFASVLQWNRDHDMIKHISGFETKMVFYSCFVAKSVIQLSIQITGFEDNSAFYSCFTLFFMPTSSKKELQRFSFVCLVFYSLFLVLRVISSCFTEKKTWKTKYASYSYFTVIFDAQTNKMELNGIKYMF